jgi:N-acetyl sugar amidotransferase
MNESAKDISFDTNGVCNYCSEFLLRCGKYLNKSPADRERELSSFIAKTKQQGLGKRYDCVLGVSGGVDSSWALVLAVKAGLRPLAVHLDNGWNSELAQNNISNLVKRLGVDLYTHVIDWPEYRALMQSFFDADVIDVELLYDNAMLAVNFQQAREHGVKSILTGANQATEGMRIPSEWNWFKYDRKNIEAIAKQFGNVKIKTFPAIGTFDFMYYCWLHRIFWISFLDYYDYQKKDALEALKKDYDYKPYPYKHYESIFTRFYQGYILPQKFAVDKRRMHLSSLIISKQLTREEALKSLEQIPYPSESALEADKEYFLKKMGWSKQQLEEYIRRPGKSHELYGSEKWLWDFFISRRKKRKA